MLYILGRILARTNEGTAGIDSVLHIFKPVSATLAVTTESITATGFSFDEGPIQDLDEAIIRESTTLTLTQESIDGLDLEMILDQRGGTISSISLPVSKKGIVTSAAIADADLTADQDVVATVFSDTAPLRLKRVLASATPSAGQFEVGSGTLSFNAAQEGATVVYNYLKSASAVAAIGGTVPDSSFGEMSFSGVLKGTRIEKQIYIPRIVRTGDKNLAVSGAIEAAEMQFKCLTPAGWTKPYILRNVA